MTTYQRTLWLGVAFAAALSCWRAPFPRQMYLQHLPTVVLLLILPFAVRRYAFSNVAFTGIILLMLFHVLGARYIYSYVPYDVWSERLFGINLTKRFGFRRNHYDRVVHFAFGLFAVRPAWEILTGPGRVPPRLARYLAIEFVLAFSLLYELFEWGLTMVLSPADAGAYNGEQGDIWDAHRDMSLALLGGCLALIIWAMARLLTPSAAASR
ncbi:MAG TPA: DUF2238 domain-containing protein [Thermoanaerobaculia bacterium]|nr:DUF2238 domain-containing protein [Thermoanaerobaculia bacterium]